MKLLILSDPFQPIESEDNHANRWGLSMQQFQSDLNNVVQNHLPFNQRDVMPFDRMPHKECLSKVSVIVISTNVFTKIHDLWYRVTYVLDLLCDIYPVFW